MRKFNRKEERKGMNGKCYWDTKYMKESRLAIFAPFITFAIVTQDLFPRAMLRHHLMFPYWIPQAQSAVLVPLQDLYLVKVRLLLFSYLYCL